MKSEWEQLCIVASVEDPESVVWPQIFTKDLYSFSYSAFLLGRIPLLKQSTVKPPLTLLCVPSCHVAYSEKSSS